MKKRIGTHFASSVRMVFFVGSASLLPLLNGCGQSDPSFVESDQGTVFKVEGSAADAQAALPSVDSAKVESILADMDKGVAQAATARASQSASSSDSKSKSHSKSSDHKADSDSSSAGVASSADSEHEDGDDDALSDNEMKACLALTGGSESQLVKVNGSEHEVKLSASSIVEIKVTGSHNVAKLDFSKTEGYVSAVCVFAAGNKAKVDIDLSIEVGRLVYVARGNQAVGDIHVGSTGSIKSEVVDLGGHESKLTVHGEGSYSQDSAIVRGSSSGFVCSPK